MTRILRAAAALSTATAALLASSSTTAMANPSASHSDSHNVSISWWTWATNTQNVIAAFEKAHPGISIPPVPNYGAGTPFYAKLTTALEGGTAPCVTFVELDHLPQFLASHSFVPITKYVQAYKSDFPAWVWQQVSQGGQVYAVPDNIGPMGLMYQPSVFKKYHLAVPATWNQFASEAVALHKINPKMYLDYFAPNDGDLLESLWWQAGARPYVLERNGTWKVTLDGPTERKVLNFWGTLVKEGAVKIDNDYTANWGHHIAEDYYAAMLGAAWSPSYGVDAFLPKDSSQTWAVTQMPQWTPGAHATANWGGGVEGVTKDCPAKDVKDAALFAAYSNTAKSELAIDAKPSTAGGRGIFAAAIGRASVPQFSAPVPHFLGKVNLLFNKYAGQVVTNFEWSPWDSEFNTFASTQLSAAAAGRESWDQALQKTQSQLVGYAKSAGYSVVG